MQKCNERENWSNPTEAPRLIRGWLRHAVRARRRAGRVLREVADWRAQVFPPVKKILPHRQIGRCEIIRRRAENKFQRASEVASSSFGARKCSRAARCGWV